VLRWQVKDSFGFREVSKTDGGRDNKSTCFAQAKRKKIDNVAFVLDNQNPLPGAASICASFIAEITSIRQRRLLRSRFSRSAPLDSSKMETMSFLAAGIFAGEKRAVVLY